MGNQKYSIRIDLGTESGWALLEDAADGHEVESLIYQFANGVIIPTPGSCLGGKILPRCKHLSIKK